MRRNRLLLFAITLILICLGVVMIYSASSSYGLERYKDSAFFFKRHLVYLVLGFIISLVIMSVDYRFFQKHSRVFLVISFFLLILVLIPHIGREIGGAKRWFRLGMLSFQPSEFAKFSVIVYMADALSRRQERLRNFLYGFIPPMFILGCCVGLVLLQPDLGTAIAITLIVFIMFFVAGIKLIHIFPVVLSSLPVLYALVFNVAYRRKRIFAFLNPWEDPKGIGFQIIQSFIALGSGGLFGVGLGKSRQKLLYLPAAHTDFIFSIIGEELGFIGSATIILLFVLFILCATKIILNSSDRFSQLLGLGIISMIALEAMINIGV
ncbi:MAG: putative lipid II flippase FtsW, partial [Candidatus Omnitrophica bacterium]|nr:putative lipid II flippase FtsW [Candidatus Omnitrophota bacterium]